MDVVTARGIAEHLLAEPLPQRWAHTQGVAQQAQALSHVLGSAAPQLEAAAWLHDIGYAPTISNTGFHPLDGARYLRDMVRASGVVCVLVAHHSGAAVEGGERSLAAVLDQEFPLDGISSELLDALTACDMTVGPAGEIVTPEDRVAEIKGRYAPDDPVFRAVSVSALSLITATRRYF